MLKNIAFFLTFLERKKPYELMGRVNTIKSFMVSRRGWDPILKFVGSKIKLIRLSNSSIEILRKNKQLQY